MSVSQAQNGRDTIPTPSFSLTWLYLDLLLANPEWILRVAEWKERERERDLEGNRKVMDFVPSLSLSGVRPGKYSAKLRSFRQIGFKVKSALGCLPICLACIRDPAL